MKPSGPGPALSPHRPRAMAGYVTLRPIPGSINRYTPNNDGGFGGAGTAPPIFVSV